ncbi:hypothetical protein ACOME3_004695 [Neoechinorhynchus agilis]
MISCIVIAFAWQKIHNSKSVVLLVTVFVLALVDTASSISYMDYMKKYKTKFVNAVLLGESIGTLLPPSLALVQGIGEINCTYKENNLNGSLVVDIIPPRFSVRVFFIVIAIICCISLSAFILLRREFNGWFTEAQSFPSEEHSRQALLPKPKDEIECRRLLILSLPINCILFGILPTLSSYSLIPYGHVVYYIGSILNPIASSISLLPKMIWPKLKLEVYPLVGIFIFGCLPVSVIVATSIMSPCPFWNGSQKGSVIVLVSWFTAQLTLSFIRIQIANTISQLDSTKLFWFGVTVQAGGFVGAVPMYIVSTKGLLKSGDQCNNVCK